MLGCMVESGLGIAAGAQIASLCDHVDLDGNLLLADDPWPGVEFVDGVQLPSDEPGSASEPRRLLILAEGHSADPHYGKTARGVMRYRPEEVVALLDSERAGETEAGFPSSARVDEALGFEPTAALVGVATAGGRFPPAWRELLRSCIAAGLDVENGLHEFVSDDPELVELAARHDVELRDLRKPPPGLNVPTGANLDARRETVLTVGSDCAIGKMTVALELDAEARRRGDRERVRPDRPDGDRDRRLGHLGRRGRRRLRRRRRRAARPRRRERGGDAPLGRGPGLAAAPGVLGRHARPDPRLRAARATSSATWPASGSSTTTRASRCRRSASSSSSTSGSRSSRGRRGCSRSRSTRETSTRAARGRRSQPRRPRPASLRRSVRFGAAPIVDAVLGGFKD